PCVAWLSGPMPCSLPACPSLRGRLYLVSKHSETSDATDSTSIVAPATQVRMSAEVREMFASIARRYDTANELLSLGIHKGWRRAAVQVSGARAGQRVLDCATGTGDLALEFKRAVGTTGE